MMRCVVKFLDENKEGWIRRRATQLKERRQIENMEVWRTKTIQEKINILKKEEN